MKTKTLLTFVFAIGVCEMAGIVGSLFTFPAIGTWYATLTKPAIAPPNWIFGPVWTSLYALMGISLALVWQKKSAKIKKERERGIRLFFLQLGLNVLWSLVFFGLHNPQLALVEIVLLWVAVAATLKVFASISRPAAYLLVPYLAWISFAGYLNYQLWVLNR